VVDKEPDTMTDAVRSAIRYESLKKMKDQYKKESNKEETGRRWHDDRGRAPDKGRYVRAVNTDGHDSLDSQRQEEEMKSSVVAEVERRFKDMEKCIADTMTRAVTAAKTPAVPPLMPARESAPSVPVSRSPERPKIKQSNVTCYRCGETGHFASGCTGPLRCYKCRKDGHIARECQSSVSHQGNERARGRSGDSAGRPQ
jgi:hypothetical protein